MFGWSLCRVSPGSLAKTKTHRNRLINPRFTDLAQRVLTPSGVVYLRTDHAEYFAQMLEVFGANPNFRACPTPPDLAQMHTDFERTFHARGVETLCAAYEVVERPTR